jgi:hypothetical protein
MRRDVRVADLQEARTLRGKKNNLRGAGGFAHGVNRRMLTRSAHDEAVVAFPALLSFRSGKIVARWLDRKNGI